MADDDDHGRGLPPLPTMQSDNSLVSPLLPDSPCNDWELPEGQPDSPTSATELPMCLKVFVFIVFTQVVQALMSYDGGATQFSTEALGTAGWSPLELGILGAMDKIGQVATAFIWGGLLMRYDNKLMLAFGLFWKALCCFLFGFLQQQDMTIYNKFLMVVVKLGMGISEALISVWATVWVQRMAPPDARARWLGLAGTSAGIGNGVGSGVASLWDPVNAFFLQATVLFAILGILIFLPGRAFSFKSAGADLADHGGEARRSSGEEGEAMPIMSQARSIRPETFLFTEVAYRVTQSHTIVIESVRYPGYFLDASVDEQDTPMHRLGVDVGTHYKVRLTKADITRNGDWARFKMCLLDNNVVTFESVRLPGHFLDARKARLTQGDPSRIWAQFVLDRAWNAGPVHIQSSGTHKRGYLASGERRGQKPRVTTCIKDAPGADDQFLLKEAPVDHTVCPEPRIDTFVEPPLGGCMASCCSGEIWEVISNRLWLWTALSISLCCFVTSGVSFLWQNTLQHVWGVSSDGAFYSFIISTGVGGLVGVVFGPKLFDGHLGGFGTTSGKATCLLWCMRLTCLAALCGTVCAVLLLEKAAYLVYSNEGSIVYWTLAVLNGLVFIMFACINAITGVLYGINTEAAADEHRATAAGLTVSFQNVFGFACGPLVPGAFAAFVGISVSSWWPEFHWDLKALDGAKYSAGMSLAFVISWSLFLFARRAAQRARVMALRA